ncbi:MAG: serine/threonine protein kinase [Muribaculaceae bacterium]|nr:serine/threonine protein kinase [Muribaculaceae bacterium]
MANKPDYALSSGVILRHGAIEYRIERFLGAGGFGITYLVSGRRRSSTYWSEKFCIKELFMAGDCERDRQTHEVIYSRPAKERVKQGQKDFIAEAKRLRDKIQHSHIVKVRDVFEINNTAYYVMEFLEGKSLRSYIKKNGPRTEQEVLSLLRPIVCAVGHLHSERITHLDIKPDNIMIIERDGNVSPKLIDFGLSKHYNRNGQPTSTIRVVATSDGYSPIEQYQGITDFQPTADIYALSATIVYSLTGKDPNKSADVRPGEFRKLLQDVVSTPTLEGLLNALKPGRYERTQSIRELADSLYHEDRIETWDIDSDTNPTDPLLFKSGKKRSILSTFKNIFVGSKVRKKEYLPMPVEITIYIRRYDGTGPSMYICLNDIYTNSPWLKDEEPKSYSEWRFFDGIHDDVLDYLKVSGLLDKDHWENEYSPIHEDDNKHNSVIIILRFGAKTKEIFIRKNVLFYGNSRLSNAIDGLLNCDSIKSMIFNEEYYEYIREYNQKKEEKGLRDDEDPEYESSHVITSPLRVLEDSEMLGYIYGNITRISLRTWQSISQSEKDKFSPLLIELPINGNIIAVAAKKYKDVQDPTEVKKLINDTVSELNPSGLDGYEEGIARLPSVAEALIIEDNIYNINATLEAWEAEPIDDYFWMGDNDNLTPNSTDPVLDTTLKINLRMIIDYYGTVGKYQSNDNLMTYS